MVKLKDTLQITHVSLKVGNLLHCGCVWEHDGQTASLSSGFYHLFLFQAVSAPFVSSLWLEVLPAFSLNPSRSKDHTARANMPKLSAELPSKDELLLRAPQARMAVPAELDRVV